MNYSLFILFGSDKDKAEEFMSNTDWKTHMAAGAVDAVSSANKLKDNLSVALTDNITEMTFNTSVVVYRKYQTKADLTEWDDVGTKKLKHTLTVKGNLEYPKILFKLGVETAKKKDTSRIWTWVNTPLGVAKSVNEKTKRLYYRDVVATVFSTDDRQFRAIWLKDASVGSYEEYFDKNGEGHFTLVINKMIELPFEQAPASSEITANGPQFGMTFSSFTGDIGKAAKTAGKLTEDAANVTEKVLGKDNEAVKKMHKAAEGMDKGGDDIQKVLSDGSAFNPDDIAKEVDEHAKFVKETKDLHDGKKDDNEVQNTTVEDLGDGKKRKTVTVNNDDDSQDITITTTDKDGNESVEKKHVDPKGYKDW